LAQPDHRRARRCARYLRLAFASGSQPMIFGLAEQDILPIVETAIITLIILLGAVLVAAFMIYVERRLLGLWQDRYGPNRAGPFGLLQVPADMIKIFFKEDWIPPFADKTVFVIAPAIIMFTTLMS